MYDASRAALLQAELDRFVAVVSEQIHPERIVVFGSFATGCIGEWSDLDVVVILDTNLPFLERVRLILRQVSPKVTMDVVVYTPAEWMDLKKTRPFVRDEIVAKGKIVYERSRAAVG
jgi:predicted nucleotidyltransferase